MSDAAHIEEKTLLNHQIDSSTLMSFFKHKYYYLVHNTRHLSCSICEKHTSRQLIHAQNERRPNTPCRTTWIHCAPNQFIRERFNHHYHYNARFFSISCLFHPIKNKEHIYPNIFKKQLRTHNAFATIYVLCDSRAAQRLLAQ